MVKAGINYRIVSDEIGSVRLVISAAGVVSERIDYDEFGTVLADSAPGFQPFGFAGGLMDLDTGLTKFGARDYDPVTARWTVKDPLRFGGGLANLYSYVDGDPINDFDPSGLATWLCQKPLNALGGKSKASNQKKSLFGSSPLNPLFHQYLCTNLGGTVEPPLCGGQDAAFIFAPGRQSTDFFVPQRCEQVPANRCVDECVAGGVNSKHRPFYNLFSSVGIKGLGKNCQDWSNDLLEHCQDRCAGAGPFSSAAGY
jgi:RHS repeat-associated protein